jgi:hypothetical protein
MKREPGARGYNWTTLSLGGGHKYTDLVLWVGELNTGLTTFLCKKKLLLQNPKKQKPDGLNKAQWNRQVWQNLVRKAVA